MTQAPNSMRQGRRETSEGVSGEGDVGGTEGEDAASVHSSS